MDHPMLSLAIGTLIVLFAAWIMTGGPDKYESTAGKFIQPPSPLSTGEIYDEPILKEDSVLKKVIPN